MASAQSPRVPGALQSGAVAVPGVLLALAAVAWVATSAAMPAMDAPLAQAGALASFVGAWVLMMAAMMLPSSSPVVATYGRLHQRRRARGLRAPVGAPASLLGGYLAVWTAAGLLGYAVLELGAALSPPALAWDRGGPYLAGAVIVIAAGYQLTPLKDACLTRCRGPLGLFISHWHDGRAGAAWMGAVHGAYCLGCCWALMAVLFALGVMNLTWMAVVTALITLERLLPWRSAASVGIAVVLLFLGVSVAVVPEHLPGLSPSGAGAMDMGR